MDAVPEHQRVIRNAWCHGKGSSILVDKIEKKPKLGKSKNQITQKRNTAKKVVKNFSKTAGRNKWVLLRVQ